MILVMSQEVRMIRLFKTRERERVNLSYRKSKKALRLSFNGFALYLYIKGLVKATKWVVVITGTVILFALSKEYALLERGYEAFGGEYMILLLPFLYYVARECFRDTWNTKK